MLLDLPEDVARIVLSAMISYRQKLHTDLQITEKIITRLENDLREEFPTPVVPSVPQRPVFQYLTESESKLVTVTRLKEMAKEVLLEKGEKMTSTELGKAISTKYPYLKSKQSWRLSDRVASRIRDEISEGSSIFTAVKTSTKRNLYGLKEWETVEQVHANDGRVGEVSEGVTT